ncbi:1-propanol dehydrogenase PduQ [Clostridium thermobutyricum]|uniref:1-propanol dehydrogenase PduQ n=1 Tax=Clostridium thermobutyricum TaxID=29372 RepID=UPI002943AF2E|nr:1-propanol dehydrogenase PduQ [Clostridium thermobutyricum]
MRNFKIKTNIYFGDGSLEHLQNIQGKKIFIVTDPFMVKSKTVDKITDKLIGKEYKIFSDVVPDPPINIIVSGIEQIGKFNPDTIIALGGGSAIDAAKAIMDFAKKIIDIKEVEFIAIPTTSGTGSEVTSFAVITDKEKGVKYPIVSDDLLPNLAILDSELVKSVPNVITADTGMDVLTHAIEAYVSKNATDFSDALAEKAVSLVFKYLIRAYKDGNDMEAREKMHNASCLAGIAFNSASLGINHSMAHVLGAKFKIPHGRINSILLPHVIEYNADISGYDSRNYTNEAIKYSNLSKILGLSNSNVRINVRNLINEIKKIQKSMNMPTTISECNVNINEILKLKDDIAEIAIKDACTITNPRTPEKNDIINILQKIK